MCTGFPTHLYLLQLTGLTLFWETNKKASTVHVRRGAWTNYTEFASPTFDLCDLVMTLSCFPRLMEQRCVSPWTTANRLNRPKASSIDDRERRSPGTKKEVAAIKRPELTLQSHRSTVAISAHMVLWRTVKLFTLLSYEYCLFASVILDKELRQLVQ